MRSLSLAVLCAAPALFLITPRAHGQGDSAALHRVPTPEVSTSHMVKFSKCKEPIGPPQLTCKVVVPAPNEGLFAQLEGPPGCVESLSMAGGFQNMVMRFEIDKKAEFRFSGANDEACLPRVMEAPECDFSNNPFVGLDCRQVVSKTQLSNCLTCAGPDHAFCYDNLTEDRVDLRIDNVNNCSDNLSTVLNYMIAVKAKKITELGGQKYKRVYFVDPSVIQEPNCPDGCP